MTTLSPLAVQQFFDNNSIEWVGAKLFTYLAGSTTKTPTYTDSSGGTPNPNPIVLDARGQANIWLTNNVSYKFVLAPPTASDPPGSSAIWTVDNILAGGVSSFSGGTTGLTPNTPTSGAVVLAGTLVVANGGTGASVAGIAAFNNITGYTSTGATGTTSGKIVFDVGATTTNQTLVTPIVTTPAITGGTITPAATPAANAPGYLGSPINLQNNTYATLMTDAGETVYHTSGSAHTWTIDDTVAYPNGTIIALSNENGGGSLTIAINNSAVLRWGASTGSRTLAANGDATVQKKSASLWRILGTGIS